MGVQRRCNACDAQLPLEASAGGISWKPGQMRVEQQTGRYDLVADYDFCDWECCLRFAQRVLGEDELEGEK